MSINYDIPRQKKVRISLQSNLDDWDGVTGPRDRDLRQVVVQKTYVDQECTYALQHVAGDTFVYCGPSGKNVLFDKAQPILSLTGSAAGHTQTFEYAGRPKQWFIGTKPNDINSNWSSWSKQIARVTIPRFAEITNHAAMSPCLSNLNHAGGSFGVSCADDQLARVEAAVSPDYQYFLIAYGDNQYNGYFALYYLDEINAALDCAAAENTNVDIADVQCVAAFMIPNLSGSKGQIGSLQGFGISNDQDKLVIYVSSQPAGDITGLDRKIVKVPWGEMNPANWELVDLTKAAALEITGYYTEIEGIQVVGHNEVYLTVAYHQSFCLAHPLKHPTKINKVYKISWETI